MKNLVILLLTIPIWGLAQIEIEASFFDKLIEEHEIPGLSIAIVKGDQLLYSGAHGVKATDTNEPLDEQTIFAAASLSKPLFAYAVMQLVEAGRLELDKPLYQYLEYEDIAHDERYQKITARMLLSHSAGFPNWRRGDLSLLFDPGERFQYSGEGYVYLMRVVEHITQQPLDVFMDKMVYRPLAMKKTSYVWQEQFEDNYAAPHDDLGFALSKYKPKEGNTAHSLQTTAKDFGKFLMAFLNEDHLQSSTMKEILQPQIEVGSSGNLHWGLGWGLQQTPKGKAVWQWGDNGTYRAFIIAYPASREGMVYFTNSNNGLRIVPELIDYIYQESCPAFEWLGYSSEVSPQQQLLKNILAKGYEEAVQPFLAPGGRHQDTAQINEQQMNNLGYRLMNQRRLEDAKKVFRANMQAFPQSANVYDSYAEACLRSGAQETALKYYKKASTMNPELKTAAAISRQLSADVNRGNVAFRLNQYPYAKLVTVAGSFNDWNSLTVPMVRRNGQWIARLDLQPGTYEYKFVVDDVWIIDPDNKKIKETDDTINSVIMVE